MEYISSILSLTFLSGAVISIYWGLAIIKLDSKSALNRLFLLVCISLNIWYLGFAIANSSVNLATALFWRRFSSIGMASIFSLTLHFLLLLTREEKERNFENVLYLLHIPALIWMYIFTFSPNMASTQYDLVRMNYGLVNTVSNGFWSYFYYSYYILYMVYGLFVMWRWKRGLEDKSKIKHARFIFLAILSSLIFGSLADIIANSFLSKQLAQIAPLFILLPIGAMYYSANYYNLNDYKERHRDELIITEEEKQNIFKNMYRVFFISGMLIFIFEYGLFMKSIENTHKWGFLEGMIFIMIGINIHRTQRLKNKLLKELLTIIILLVSIPIITLDFLQYAGVTIWAFPIIIIIASLVFSKKILLVSTTVVSIITQSIIWLLKPELLVTVNKNDYIFRIIILTSAFIVGSYVNKIYRSKLEENDFQIRFQKMIAKISSDFIGITEENADGKIDEFLSLIGSFFEGDRTYLGVMDYEENTIFYSHEWCNKGVECILKNTDKLSLENYHYLIEELRNDKLIYIEDRAKLEKFSAEERKQFIMENTKSLVLVSVEGKERMKAFIGIDFIESYRKWTDQDNSLLTIVSNLMSEALTKMKSEREIAYMAHYDRLTDLPNRFLFKNKVDNVISLTKNTEELMSIIFVDLDNFKSVNDNIGHDGGDCLLREVASRLKNTVRKTDVVARFGGDEFMIMLNHIENPRDALKVADNIMDIFSKPFYIFEEKLLVSASLGISLFPIDGEDTETLIKNADTAMYQAKSKGKNSYATYTSKIWAETQKNITMLNDLCDEIDGYITQEKC